MKRATELPQRPSLTGLPCVRTSTSDRDKVFRRPLTEISPRLLSLRTPRVTQTGVVNPKKLGTRITDLETQLVQAQHELKCLKHHLSSTDVVKKPLSTENEAQSSNSQLSEITDDEKTGCCEKVKENEKEELINENGSLKHQLEEAKIEAVKAQTKEEDLTAKLSQVRKELEASKANEAELKERLREVEVKKESLENEMMKMKVQTEQWKKAADEAASVLAARVSFNGRISNGFGFIDDVHDGFGTEKRRNSGIRIIGDLWKRKPQKQ